MVRGRTSSIGTGDTPASFENFELSVEVMTKPDANSGVYFHTSWLETGWPTHQGFEVGWTIPSRFRATTWRINARAASTAFGTSTPSSSTITSEVHPHLIVRKPRVEIRVNGVLVVDYIEPAEPLPASAPKFNHLGSRTFALQAHDPASHAAFRNLRVRRLPATVPGSVQQPLLDSELERILPLAKDNFPLIDLHMIINEQLTLEDALAHSRSTGVGLGISLYQPTKPRIPQAPPGSAGENGSRGRGVSRADEITASVPRARARKIGIG